MIHVGDITQLNGADLPPVDIITGGSPCQDLSVAGARAGLAGKCSGLFMEQIRIIKEMRVADIQRGRSTEHAQFACFGYRQDENGNLVIHEEEAEIVRRIFQMRAAGHSLGRISDWLFENEISTPRGKARWSSEAIRKLLKNEKYVGDVLLQKTYVEDVLTGKQIKNDGEKSMVRISNHHPAIILKDLFEKVNHTGNNP